MDGVRKKREGVEMREDQFLPTCNQKLNTSTSGWIPAQRIHYSLAGSDRDSKSFGQCVHGLISGFNLFEVRWEGTIFVRIGGKVWKRMTWDVSVWSSSGFKIIGGSIYWISVDSWEFCRLWENTNAKAVSKCLLARIKWIIANNCTGTIYWQIENIKFMYIHVLKHETISINVIYIRIVYFHRKCENVPPLYYYAKLYCKVDNEKIFHE